MYYSFLHTVNKDSITPLHWRSLYCSLFSLHSNYTEVLCEGSLQDTLSECAVWWASFSFQAEIPPSTSIFISELYTIFYAATYVGLNTLQHYLSFIRTLSVLRISTFCSYYPSSHYLVPKFSSLLSDLPPNSFTLIPLSADDLRPRIYANYRL